MKSIKAEKSEIILNTLVDNVNSFQGILQSVEDELTKQNIMRSIILFSCSGIDAVVKQLIMETLELVIERDEGAQDQLKKYANRRIKKSIETDCALLGELYTARSPRKELINILKMELAHDSLQSSEQLYKVASYFNISTDALVGSDKATIEKAFYSRNIIVHQMDVELNKSDMPIVQHEISEINEVYESVIRVASNFINIVNEKLKLKRTASYAPIIGFEEDRLIVNEL